MSFGSDWVAAPRPESDEAYVSSNMHSRPYVNSRLALSRV